MTKVENAEFGHATKNTDVKQKGKACELRIYLSPGVSVPVAGIQKPSGYRTALGLCFLFGHKLNI